MSSSLKNKIKLLSSIFLFALIVNILFVVSENMRYCTMAIAMVILITILLTIFKNK